MKNKTSLVLMEQLVMVLVFALAAVVCLGIFFQAEQTAEASRRREEGAYLAQNGAELLKNGGDPRSLPLPQGYRLTVEEEASGVPGLGTARIQVSYEGQPIFSLTTGWQEELP